MHAFCLGFAHVFLRGHWLNMKAHSVYFLVLYLFYKTNVFSVVFVLLVGFVHGAVLGSVIITVISVTESL